MKSANDSPEDNMETVPDFASMNETDVREIIVRPLLERLGYRHGTDANIRTEQRLTYAHTFLGRKNPSQRYLKFDPAGRPSEDLVDQTRTREGDRWRHSQGCLAACCSLYTTVLTVW
jgi:hypothetical protein